MTRFTRFAQMLLPVLALCLTVGTTSAFAQSNYEANVRGQIIELLSSKSPDVQASGLDFIVQLTEQDDPVVDPYSFRDRIFDIYFNTKRPEDLRMAAMDALEATGNNEKSIQMIVKHLRNEPSVAVRQHTLSVLSKHNAVSRG